jgi:D-arabinose 1-dehydrogenase-like Zn-dependent alcohol dehydrogenase
MNRYAQLMAPFGHVYALTVSGGTLNFPYNKLLEKELSIHGSCSSTMAEVEKMMDFVVSHRIKPAIEKFPFSVDGINKAFDKLDRGTIRYRAVLEV